MTRATRHRTTVTVTKVQFQWCWPSTVATPRKMKISVSLTLLHIFRKYLMVVCDLWEMLASTYGRITAPHAINLEARGERHFKSHPRPIISLLSHRTMAKTNGEGERRSILTAGESEFRVKEEIG